MTAYCEMRDHINDGDLIFVSHPFLPLFYRSAVAVWMRDAAYKSRLFAVEFRKGSRVITTLSSYRDKQFEVVHSEIPFLSYAQSLLDHDCDGPQPRSFCKDPWSNSAELLVSSLNKGGLYLPPSSHHGLYKRLVFDMGWKTRSFVGPH